MRQRVDIQAQFDVIRKQIEETLGWWVAVSTCDQAKFASDLPPRKEAVAFKKRQGILRVAAATGGGARRLDEFQMLPSSPSVQQDRVVGQPRLSCQDQKVMSVLQGDGGMSSDTEYLQHRAKDRVGPFGGILKGPAERAERRGCGPEGCAEETDADHCREDYRIEVPRIMHHFVVLGRSDLVR